MPTVLCISGMLGPQASNACAYLGLILLLTKRILRDEFTVRFVQFEHLKYCTGDIVIVQRLSLCDLVTVQQVKALCDDMGQVWLRISTTLSCRYLSATRSTLDMRT